MCVCVKETKCVFGRDRVRERGRDRESVREFMKESKRITALLDFGVSFP